RCWSWRRCITTRARPRASTGRWRRWRASLSVRICWGWWRPAWRPSACSPSSRRATGGWWSANEGALGPSPNRLRVASDDPVDAVRPGVQEEGERRGPLGQAGQDRDLALGVGAVAADPHAVDGRHELPGVVAIRAAAADDVAGLEPDLAGRLAHQSKQA